MHPIFIQSNIMNTFEITYQGDLRTTATHLDSGSEISTDAPKDNHGLGEAFSPTDMVCSALASCILTIICYTTYDIVLYSVYDSAKRSSAPPRSPCLRMRLLPSRGLWIPAALPA